MRSTINKTVYRRMLPFVLLLVPMVLAGDATPTINHSVVDIEHDTLTSVKSMSGSLNELDLSGLGIKRIRKRSFDNAINAKFLDLADNSLVALPKSVFSRLKKLEHLSLANNNIQHFAGAFAGLRNLKSLNISGNPFTAFRPGEFYGLSCSIDIFVRGNSLTMMSTNLFEMPGSDSNAMDYPRDFYPEKEENPDINEAPQSVWVAPFKVEPNLRVKVCIDNGRVTLLDYTTRNEVLPTGCRPVKNDDCCSLYMDDIGIASFDRGWYRLENNRTISISTITLKGNRIARISHALLNDLPASVRIVDLSRNKIERLASGAITNPHIQSLYLSNNLISVIEDGALADTKLWYLHLADNRLRDTKFVETLPVTVSELHLQRNLITELSGISHANFLQMDILKISDNDITILRKDSLRAFPFMYDLDLSRNRIRTLEPGCFDGTDNLRYLRLRDNTMDTLDGGVFERLAHLLLLDIGGNRLTALPEGFGESLPNDLEFLMLDYNDIERLESGSFVNVPKHLLDLRNNRITEIARGSFVVPDRFGMDMEARPFNITDLLFSSTNGNPVGKTPLAPRRPGIGNVDLSMNPIQRLDSGALNGVRKGSDNYVIVARNSIEVIQGGLFDDVNSNEGIEEKIQTR